MPTAHIAPLSAGGSMPLKSKSLRVTISDAWLLMPLVIMLTVGFGVIATNGGIPNAVTIFLTKEPTWSIIYRATMGATLCVVPIYLANDLIREGLRNQAGIGSMIIGLAIPVGLVPLGCILCGMPHPEGTLLVSGVLSLVLLALSACIGLFEIYLDSRRRTSARRA